MVKNPPADAGGTGSNPGAGSPGPATVKPMPPEPTLCTRRRLCNEEPADCSREQPPGATTGHSPQQSQRPGPAKGEEINRLQNRRQAAGRTQTVRVNNMGQD